MLANHVIHNNMSENVKIRLIASYLPQFHPIPENDIWWGKGFTEWTNVKRAIPLFNGHEQPKIPGELDYYDLRSSEIREKQAIMARDAGIEGFCYWHYWFGNGKRILEKIFADVLSSGKPDYPFCLAWANESWSGVWHGAKNKILLEQLYPGTSDYKKHYKELSEAFHDLRYIRIDGKPLFMIYKPWQLPNPRLFMDIWKDLAIRDGFPGFFFVAQSTYANEIEPLIQCGFDAVNVVRLYDYEKKNLSQIRRGMMRLLKELHVYEYGDAMKFFSGAEDKELQCIPTIIPNWDHSPRSGRRGYILHNSTPALFKEHINQIFENIKNKPYQHRIAFIKSWNEWGEGNYLEPDSKFGHSYLNVLRDCLKELD